MHFAMFAYLLALMITLEETLAANNRNVSLCFISGSHVNNSQSSFIRYVLRYCRLTLKLAIVTITIIPAIFLIASVTLSMPIFEFIGSLIVFTLTLFLAIAVPIFGRLLRHQLRIQAIQSPVSRQQFDTIYQYVAEAEPR